MVRIADSTVLFEGCWFACGPNPVFDRDLRSAPQNNLQNSKRNCLARQKNTEPTAY